MDNNECLNNELSTNKLTHTLMMMAMVVLMMMINSHIVHCTHTMESANVKVQNISQAK